MLKANLVGNVGGDPEYRYSAGDSPTLVMRFSVAHNYRKRNREGDWEDRTEWLRIVVFGQLAERLKTHEVVKRGMKIYVHGRMEFAPWTRQDGTPEAGAELHADEVESMMPSQGGNGNGRDRGWGDDTTGRPSGRAPVAATAGRGRTAPDDDLEDLPF